MVAILAGIAVAILPLSLSIVLGATLLAPLVMAVAWLLPNLRSIPSRWLLLGLLAALFAYFVWPRYAFIPIKALPIKHPQKILYLSLICFWLFCVFKSNELRERLVSRLTGHPWITASFATLVLTRWTSVAASEVWYYSSTRAFDDTLSVFLLYPLTLTIIGNRRAATVMAATLVAAGVLNALIAIPESYVKHSLFERFITLDLVDPGMAEQIISAKVRGGAYRAQASFDHPLLFVEFLVVTLPIAAFWALGGGRFRWASIFAVAAMCVGLVLVHSRSSLVGLLVLSVMTATLGLTRIARNARESPWPLVWAVFATPLILIASIGGIMVAGELLAGAGRDEYRSTLARQEMLRQGLPLIEAEWLLGYGPGLAGYVLGFRNTFDVVTLDNYYLAATLDSGVFFTMAFLIFGLSGAVRSGLLAVTNSDRAVWTTSGGLCAGIFGFFVMKGVLGTPLNNGLLMVLVALVVVVSDTSDSGGRRFGERAIEG